MSYYINDRDKDTILQIRYPKTKTGLVYNNAKSVDIILHRYIYIEVPSLLESKFPNSLSNLIISYIPQTIECSCTYAHGTFTIKSTDDALDINIKIEFCFYPPSFSISSLHNLNSNQIISYFMLKLYNIDKFLGDTVWIHKNDQYSDQVYKMDRIIKNVDYRNAYNELCIFKLFHDILLKKN